MWRTGTRGAATLLLVVSVVPACGADIAAVRGEGPDAVTSSATASTTRPPLADPPDPGPVPVADGLSESQRAVALAATAGVSGTACGRLSEGTAFAIGSDLLLTSAHVLVGLESVTVELADGRMPDGVVVVGFDAAGDVAALHVPDAQLDPLTIGEAVDGTTGAGVGWEASGPEASPFRIDRPVTVRIDDAARAERVERPSWLVAARVDDGDSGGPLVDDEGRVVGVLYAATRRDSDVAYALRSSELASVIEESAGRRAVAVPSC